MTAKELLNLQVLRDQAQQAFNDAQKSLTIANAAYVNAQLDMQISNAQEQILAINDTDNQ